MSKLCGQNIFLMRATGAANVITVVADESARDAIVGMVEDDLAYLKSEDRYDSYESAVWVDNGGDAHKIALRSENFDEAFAVVDITDNTTAGDGTESAVLRATRSITVETILRDGSDNKVVGTDMALTYDSTSEPVRSFTYSEAYNEADITDSSTTGDGDEFCATRAVRTSDIVVVQQNDQSTMTTGQSLTATLQFKTGLDITGSLQLESLGSANAIDTTQEDSYSGQWQGAVTNPIPLITSAQERATLMVVGQGRTYLGEAVSMGHVVSIAYNAEGTVTYNLKFNGAITKGAN